MNGRKWKIEVIKNCFKTKTAKPDVLLYLTAKQVDEHFPVTKIWTTANP